MALSLSFDDDAYIGLIAKRISQQTMDGQAPWMKSHGEREIFIAHNPCNGAVFKGANGLLLDLVANERGFKDPRWITEEQAKSRNLKLRYREEGTPVAYMNVLHAPSDIQEINQSDSFARDRGMVAKEPTPKATMRYEYMYNVEQFQGNVLAFSHDSIDSQKTKIAQAEKNMGAPANSCAQFLLEKGGFPDQLKHTMTAIASYRFSLETGLPYTPISPVKSMQDEVASMHAKPMAIVKTAHAAEVKKEQLINPGMVLEATFNEKNRRAASRDISMSRDIKNDDSSYSIE